MNTRALAAASADNSVAEDMDDEAFLWGDGVDSGHGTGETPGIVSSSDELSDDQIAADAQQTSEELGDQTEEPATEEAPAGTQPPAANPAGNQQQTPPVQQPPQAAPQAQQPVQPQAPTSEQPQQRAPLFHEMVNANFDTAVEHIAAQPAFKLSPEDAETLDPAAAAIVEKQSAKVFLRAMSGFSEMLHNTLPGVVHSLIGVNQSGKQVADKFYEDNGFDRAQHEQELVRIAGYLRQSRPDFNRDQLMAETARVAHALLGTQPPAPKANGGKPQAPTNGQPKGARVVSTQRAPAFTPAARTPGGGAPQARRAPGQQPQQVNPLQDLSNMLASNTDLD